MSDANDQPSPGPWHVTGPAVYDRNHDPVAVCGPSGPYEANAAFIADAPVMMDLLHAAHEQIELLRTQLFQRGGFSRNEPSESIARMLAKHGRSP